MKTKKTIGIIGGMGPLATVDIFEKIVKNTKASKDSEHIHIIIDNYPQIPDRTEAILSGKESPVPYIIDSANRLVKSGADFIVIPCNTSHFFYDEIINGCKVPVLNMIEETMFYLEKNKLNKAFLFATDGVIATKIYERYATKHNIDLMLPTPEEQKEIMGLIYNGVKKYDLDYDIRNIQVLINDICVKKSIPIILGCTELPVAIHIYNLNGQFIDPTLIIAKKAIAYAGYDQI